MVVWFVWLKEVSQALSVWLVLAEGGVFKSPFIFALMEVEGDCRCRCFESWVVKQQLT